MFYIFLFFLLSLFPAFSFSSLWNLGYLDDECARLILILLIFSVLFVISLCFNGPFILWDTFSILSFNFSFDFKNFVHFSFLRVLSWLLVNLYSFLFFVLRMYFLSLRMFMGFSFFLAPYIVYFLWIPFSVL